MCSKQETCLTPKALTRDFFFEAVRENGRIWEFEMEHEGTTKVYFACSGVGFDSPLTLLDSCWGSNSVLIHCTSGQPVADSGRWFPHPGLLHRGPCCFVGRCWWYWWRSSWRTWCQAPEESLCHPCAWRSGQQGCTLLACLWPPWWHGTHPQVWHHDEAPRPDEFGSFLGMEFQNHFGAFPRSLLAWMVWVKAKCDSSRQSRSHKSLPLRRMMYTVVWVCPPTDCEEFREKAEEIGFVKYR